MGRAKLNMELISKEKSRNTTFKKRKEGLMRKMHEFTTLCDVSACMIIYSPTQSEPEIWPANPDEVRRIIEIYKAKNMQDSGNKTFSLSDFFHDRKRKIEDELAKLRKKNMEAKYPTWLDFLNFKSEGQLRDFAAALSSKAEYVRSRVEFLKRLNINNNNKLDLMDLSQARLSQSSAFYCPQRGMELEVINNQHQAHAINSASLNKSHLEMIHQHDNFGVGGGAIDELQQKSMMMALLMNENNHCVQFKSQAVYYEAAVGMVDPLARYYAPPIVPPLQSYMVMPAGVQFSSSPQLQFTNHDGGEEDDFVQYQMMNNHTARYFE